MGQISSVFVHKVINAATSHAPRDDARRRHLFASAGVDPSAPIDGKIMVPDIDYYKLCERVAREDEHGRSVSVRVGASMKCDDYGAFGLAWKSAVNLRGSYGRAERYGRVLTSVSTYEIKNERGKSNLVLHREGDQRLGLHISNEQTIAAITQISREVSQKDFSPEAVYFKHKSPDDISRHEDYFKCPVIFESEYDALQVSEEMLAIPNRLGDAGLSNFFDTHLEKELSELEDDLGLDQQVRIQISQALSEGVPTISDVARRLGLSGRTLQRRLSERGYAYQELVDSARQQLAEKLLQQTDYPLVDIAFLTGFSEQSAFTRAFKRWRGQTPRSYRLDAEPASG